jgi:hypothetical protein
VILRLTDLGIALLALSSREHHDLHQASRRTRPGRHRVVFYILNRK